MIPLTTIWRCFQGVIPSIIGTSDADGGPNVTYASQVHLIDDDHVALSRQFFNKTSRNLDENPLACAEVHDPVTFQSYRLHLKFLRSEKSGPLFDVMAVRIQAIASMTGMLGVFRLIGADVFEVLRVEKVEGFLTTVPVEPDERMSMSGARNEIRGLQYISEQINRAGDLDSLLDIVLEALESYFGFEHAMVLLADECTDRLVTMASRGYGTSGVGAEVERGQGLIGTAASELRVIRLTGIEANLRYGRAVRRESGSATPEIPLPGLPDAQSALVIPLKLCERLIGVLAVEDRDPTRFGEWHEAYLEIVGNQIALGIDHMAGDDEEPAPPRLPITKPEPADQGRRRTLTYYVNDDCVFIDGEYLIRNVPGRILWKLMRGINGTAAASSPTANCGSIPDWACRRSRTISRAASSCCAAASPRSAPTSASCPSAAGDSRSRSTERWRWSRGEFEAEGGCNVVPGVQQGGGRVRKFSPSAAVRTASAHVHTRGVTVRHGLGARAHTARVSAPRPWRTCTHGA